jgi:hypothetical protein
VNSPSERLEAALRGIPRRGNEGSFKLAPGRLLARRGLIGIEKRHLSRGVLLDIASRLSIPAEYAKAVEADYAKANFFYFGYEDGDDAGDSSGALKLYVEYPVYIAPLTPEERGSPDHSRPSLQALGYKWDAAGGAALAVTRYVWFVHLDPAALVQRMESIREGVTAPAFDLAQSLVAAAGASGRSPRYIEATEPGNPRASFDVNVYAANLAVSSIEARVRALGETYRIDTAALNALLAAIGAKPLGHVSGGIDRRGADFLTIYYEL